MYKEFLTTRQNVKWKKAKPKCLCRKTLVWIIFIKYLLDERINFTKYIYTVLYIVAVKVFLDASNNRS